MLAPLDDTVVAPVDDESLPSKQTRYAPLSRLGEIGDESNREVEKAEEVPL